MSVKYQIFPNLYRDSVSLMQISAKISRQEGISQASVIMGTPANLLQLQEAGFPDHLKSGPNDLIVAVSGDNAACEEALITARNFLTAVENKNDSEGGSKATPVPGSLAMAVEEDSELNMALISVPGEYATAEAFKALKLGLNVMLFSDNVSLKDEKEIKLMAEKHHLLVMGPDCGTAIINGLPLGFANVVRLGKIGIVGASGTGVQEVSSRIHRLGAGVSQAIGTGGHDLHEEIGGISMLFGLNALIEDQNTEVIVLISKPPAAAISQRILSKARAAGKPVVVNFLGADPQNITAPGITAAKTLADAAEQAAALLNKTAPRHDFSTLNKALKEILRQKCSRLSAARKDIRGVFSGGTFCYESQLLCLAQGISATSNIPVTGNRHEENLKHSHGHTMIDMGDDFFTRGRPHPMIDPTLRNERLLAEIQDPHTAVVLFDTVLGYGAAADPCQEFLQEWEHLKQTVGLSHLPLLITHVCGTDEDPQQRQKLVNALEKAGITIAECNAEAALSAAAVALIQQEKSAVKQEEK